MLDFLPKIPAKFLAFKLFKIRRAYNWAAWANAKFVDCWSFTDNFEKRAFCACFIRLYRSSRQWFTLKGSLISIWWYSTRHKRLWLWMVASQVSDIGSILPSRQSSSLLNDSGDSGCIPSKVRVERKEKLRMKQVKFNPRPDDGAQMANIPERSSRLRLRKGSNFHSSICWDNTIFPFAFSLNLEDIKTSIPRCW